MRSFSIIVPVYRDVAYTKAKIANILTLKYPAQMVEVFIAHGGAKSDRIQQLTEGDPLVRILHMKKAGKINQLNEALGKCYGDIILITDVDAMMQPNCLKELDKAFDDPKVAVAGAWTYPQNCTVIDRIYWYIANLIRVVEDKFQTCSHLSGCCMAFRKSLLSSFPEDVVADDCYVPFLANFQGLRTAYLTTTKVAEIRQPRSVGSFLAHKTRKGNAVLRELLRFMYRIADGSLRWKLIYLARLFQFTILTPTVLLSYPFIKQTSKYRKVS